MRIAVLLVIIAICVLVIIRRERARSIGSCETCGGDRMGIDANPLSLTFGEVVMCPDCEGGWVRATWNQLTLWWLWRRGYCDREREDGGYRYRINAKGRARLADREAKS